MSPRIRIEPGLEADESVNRCERALLGSVLWPDAGPLPSLRPDDFFLERHRILWRHIVTLDGGGRGPSVPLLLDRLQQEGELEEIGGTAYIAQLFEEEGGWAIPTLVTRYADEVRRASESRCLRNLGFQLIDSRYSREEVEQKLAAVPRGVLGPSLRITDRWREIQTDWLEERIRIGLPSVDRIIGGLVPGDLVVVGARPSHGKTALLVTGAIYLLQHGVPVLYLSLETSAASVCRRLIGSVASVRLSDLRAGTITPTSLQLADEAVGWLVGVPLAVRDAVSIGGKRADRVLTALAGAPERVLMIDHLQEVVTDDRENRALSLSWFCSRLKELAMRAGVVVMVGAQLHRCSEEDRYPMLSHLKESGGLEERADIVLLLHYRVKRDPKASPEELDVYVAKNRDGGTGRVVVRFEPQYARVSDETQRPA